MLNYYCWPKPVETGGRGPELIETTNFYVNFQEKCFHQSKPVYC